MTLPRPLRRLVLRGDAHARGAAHGAAFAAEIRRYTDERVHLAAAGTWSGRKASRDEVLDLAARMLPAHHAYAPDLHQEMLALADAAGITPAEALIVGGFTDFVDAVRALLAPAPEEDDCTALLVPPARGGPWFAQTWDMHDSATAHVVLLDLQPDDAPAALVFTTVGCLGQIGMNEHGLAVGINNLSAADGRVGVTWPSVVREALRQPALSAARDAVLRAHLAGGHNYLLLDAAGDGCNIEAMPTHAALTPLSESPLVHTNHCLDPACLERQAEKAPQLLDSSLRRHEAALRLLADHGVIDHAALVHLLREPAAICQVAAPPYHIETSGAVIARPDTRELWAVWGSPRAGEFERFTVHRHD